MGKDDFYFHVMIYMYFCFTCTEKWAFYSFVPPRDFELSKDLRLVQKHRRMDGLAEDKEAIISDSSSWGGLRACWAKTVQQSPAPFMFSHKFPARAYASALCVASHEYILQEKRQQGSRTFPFPRKLSAGKQELERVKMTSFPPSTFPSFSIAVPVAILVIRGFISFRYLCRAIASGTYFQRKYGDVCNSGEF
ncbi:hypothetical protein CEXT_148101 [Caerostris extrusa]|uniref:Uncharacterized protein n=1 Tax=Caerostris extrusa TaxID=172846 RepID=A0AAV4S6J9_CAEEX|nr:hypothetical protein CEXT_148101 [Caerostris extrusa]